MEIKSKKFYVNFDFDLNFLDKKVDYNFKNQYFFEFIFFILNEDSAATLTTRYSYKLDYLEKLKNMGFVIPKFSSDFSDSITWWGDFSDFEIKKKFVSKINLLETLNSFDVVPEFVAKIESQTDLDSLKLDQKAKYFFRSEYGFSGLGNKIVDGNFKYYEKGTIAPLLDVVLAFGITTNVDDGTYFICKNIINDKGNFLGGSIIGTNELSSLLKTSQEDIDLQIKEIIKIFKKLRVTGAIQFDSLIYKKENKNFWYKVVEVNYRKTMGLLVHKLHSKFGPGTMLFGKVKLSNAIEISPPENALKFFYSIDERENLL